MNHSFPLLDGYASRSQNILNAQKNMGWTPIVLTSPKHENDLKDACPKKETIGEYTFYRTGKNLFEKIPLLSEGCLLLLLFVRLVQVIIIEKPDILHAHSPVLNYLPAWLIGKLYNLPVLYEIRAYWEDAGVDLATYKKRSLKYRFVQSLETWACKQVSHVAVLCEGIRNDLALRGIRYDKLTPVFNGINPENFTPCRPDTELFKKWGLKDKKVIGFIGSFFRWEGLDLLIKAFAKLAPEKSDLMLLLVGGGEELENLQHQVSSSGLTERIIMPGRVPHHQIKGVYAMMDIMIYPRYSVRLTEIVTPLKPLEAMAMGKAVIASDIGGHRELIEHNKTGILFPAGNTAALAKTISLLMNDPKKIEILRSAGQRYVLANKTWEKTTMVYKKIYGRIKTCS
nr:TIGR04063 family PEP-CTERM/XrtA system glycosyltransferase [uncultured Desulfobacter sp.]